MSNFNKTVKIISGEHKDKIGHIRATSENCLCAINSQEASDCECEEFSDVYFDNDEKAYNISHENMKVLN